MAQIAISVVMYTLFWAGVLQLISSLSDASIGWYVGAAFGVTIGVVYPLFDAVRGLSSMEIVDEPPPQLLGRSPDSVVKAMRNSGVKVAAMWLGVAVALGFGGAALLDDPAVMWAGIAGGIYGAVMFGLWAGLGAWLFFHWQRRRLARRRAIPRHFAHFLEWCTEDPRGWLRGNDAYEFRHRELLEHLAAHAGTREGGAVTPP